MNGQILESHPTQRDLGVLISDNCLPGNQCAQAAKKANQVLGQMSRAFHYRDKMYWVRLYNTFVRPHLEYCIQA